MLGNRFSKRFAFLLVGATAVALGACSSDGGHAHAPEAHAAAAMVPLAPTHSHADEIVAEAKKWIGTKYVFGGDSASGMDCSHHVARALRQVDPNYVYKTVAQIRASSDFEIVTTPNAGDLVSWNSPQHVAVVVDSSRGVFVGAQTSTGVQEASYSSGYWSTDAQGRVFLRFKKAEE